MTRAEAWREVGRRWIERENVEGCLCWEYKDAAHRELDLWKKPPLSWFSPTQTNPGYFWVSDEDHEHRGLVALMCADIIDAGDA